MDDPNPDLDGFIGADVPAEMEKRVKAAARRQDRPVSSWLRQTLRRRLDVEDRVRERPAVPSQ